MNKTMLAFIRAFFSVASRIAPIQSGNLAFRLFCRTQKVKPKSAHHQSILSRAQQHFESATRHDIAYSNGTVAAFEFSPLRAPKTHAQASAEPGAEKSDGSDSAGEVDGSARANGEQRTVLLVHGWQSHSLFMNNFVEPLRSRGLRVIAVDLPGHGQSSGRLFHLPLGVEAMHAVQSQLGAVDLIISHSLGGAVVATTMAGTMSTHPPMSVSAAVLISSPDSMTKVFNDFSDMVGLSKSANTALHQNVTRLSGLVTDDFNVSAQLANTDTNTLLIHAPDDKEIPFSEAEAIAAANPSSTLKPMGGLGHRRIIADDDVVATAVEFICSKPQ